ncbi:MAG: SpoVG family protein [Thermoguttaceae bacterium]
MQITEVRVKLMDEPGERLKAFCSITIDNSFVVRDLKVIEGAGGPFVAMPSRKLTARCPNCGSKNHLRAAHCNHCGIRLKECLTMRDEEGRTKLYADIAHPINSACREMIQERVIKAFEEEKARSKLPGYVPSYDDFEEDTVAEARVDRPSGVEAPHGQRAPKPRKPGHAPPRQPQSQSSERPKDEFGAGIFD